MKKILFSLILASFACTASAQHTYISCSGNVIFYSGSIERYSSPDLYVDAVYHSIRGVWVATVQIAATGATTNFVGYYQIEFDNATIDALTATGATNTEDIKNCLLQAVKNYLTPLNGASSFTLN